MITKQDIQITGVNPFYNGINTNDGSINEYHLSHIDVDFLLFGTIKCEVTMYDLKHDDKDSICEEIVNYLNSKIQR